MTPSDPQYLYVILILPSLFGLVLVGEGIRRIGNDNWQGMIAVVAGLLILGLTLLSYLFFSTYLGQRV